MGVPPVAVAVKMVDWPATVAVTRGLTSALEPRVHTVCALPSAAEVAVVTESEPPPEMIAKVTWAPAMADPSRSTTRATSGAGSAVST